MKNLILMLPIICALASPILAQNSSSTPRNQAPAKSLTDKVDALFAQWDKPDSPGCALGIIQDGGIIYERGYGMANLENDIPITSQSVFDIASISKQFTAMAVLLLSQQGKISLDDDVRKYVPELPDLGTPITIRQLVYHTNGLRDTYFMLELAGLRYDDEHREEDVLALVKRTKELNHKPGEEHSYNNMGYSLLALIVDRASGQSLREYAEAHIFKPLGMSDTHIQDDHRMLIKNRTASYAPRPNGGFLLRVGALSTVGPNGVFTNVKDLAKWDQNFYDKKVGGEEGIRTMLTPGTLRDGTKIDYAFGLSIEQHKGLPLILHHGGGPGTRNSYLRFPDQRSSVILFCNSSNIDMNGLARQVADIYLADELDQVPKPENKTDAQTATPFRTSAQELASVAGLYFDDDFGRLRRLYVKDNKLFYSRSANSETELSTVDRNRFLMVGVAGKVEVAFESARAGSPQRMLVITDDGKPTVFESVKLAADNSAPLAEFAGNYYSEELDATYTIAIQKGDLLLRRKKWKDIVFAPVFADAFNDDNLGIIRFTRDSRKRISGFTLSNGNRGVRRLRFLKQTSFVRGH